MKHCLLTSVNRGNILRPRALTDITTQPRLWSCLVTLVSLLFVLVSAETGRAQETKECLECHADYYDQLAGEFNHSPFEEQDCYACHEFHGFRNKVMIHGSVEEICTACHETLWELDEESTHFPILDEQSCVTCHTPHGADNEKFLVTPVEEGLCTACHEEPDPEAKGAHQPYAESQCTTCHNAHGSLFPSALHFPAAFVCMDCHFDLAEGLDLANIHGSPEGGEYSCTGCHVGHESPHDALTRDEQPDLCLRCHEDLAEDMEDKGTHTAVSEGECTDCHSPHFEVGGTSLSESPPELCFLCHGDIEEYTQAEYPHPVIEDGCDMCHSPHTKGLMGTQVELCGVCHEPDDEAILDGHAGLQPETCSSCHNPHGSDNESLMRTFQHYPFAERECDACHEGGQEKDMLESNDVCIACHDVTGTDDTHSATLFQGKTCVDCHFPHAAPSSGLLR